MTKSYYVTTPIYYVNGAPHIGHAYTSIAADVMARWKRLDGFDVFFLTGTDEHGQKVEAAARDAGVDPQTFTDRISADFRDMTDKMGVSYDEWIRTTEERHKASCAELWRRIAASGNIYLGHYEGWYAVRDEAFYDEDELTIRPDGSKVAPSGAPVEWVREPSYFFKLSEWQDRLLKLYDDEPDFILPAGRRNEVLSFVRGGLRDLSISRTSFTWGIPVPDAPGHVMYVWLDALNNYVTACGFPDETAPRWHYWPADAHFVGKDILRFHAVYWPAFLMAAGLPVPRRVTSNGWWTVDGEKMSKSLGNVIEPRQLVAAFGAGPGALLPAAREAVRRRRHAVAPGADHADQRRAGQRPGQSGAALAVADRAQLRGQAAGEGGRQRRRCGPAARRGGAAGRAARAAGPAGVPRGAGGCLEGRPRRQRLYRPPGAVGAAPHRSGADGGGAACARGRAAGDRHGAAAVHAGQHGADAGPARGAGGGAAAGALGTPLADGTPLPAPQGVFPRYVEPAA